MKRSIFLFLSLLLALIPGCITLKVPPPPDITLPNITLPNVTLPNVTLPALTPPAITPPAITPPVITFPAVTPPTFTPPVPGSFSVTGIIAGTEPSNAPGACPFMLYANITASGPGTATYIWESMDGGGYSYTWSITFPTAGTQKITLPPEMSALPSGSYRLHVLTPNDTVSNPTYYTSCRP